MGANAKIETLSDVARKGWDLGVRCRCGHTATLDAKALVTRFHRNRWDQRIAFVHEHLWCSKCSRHPIRVGISANKPDQPRGGPLTLRGMREQNVRSVSVDCTCKGPHDVNVDHLPGRLPVPAVRFHVRCPACGGEPHRTMPLWRERGCVLDLPVRSS